VVPLFRHLLAKHAIASGKAIPELELSTHEKLLDHTWPGNVRELDNVAQRALILQGDGLVKVEHIMFEPDATSLKHMVAQELPVVIEDEVENRLEDNLKIQEFQLILEALKQFNGNRKQAADKLGISERTLRYKLARMRETGVDIPRRFSSEFA